jgi:hypothetical protein
MKKRRETFKTMLPKIVRFLNDNPEGRKLWDVLAALRGPDTSDYDHAGKKATTAVIRYAMGLRGVLGKNEFIYTVLPDTKTAAAIRANLWQKEAQEQSALTGHFVNHAFDAFKALGLDWDSENRLPDKRKR